MPRSKHGDYDASRHLPNNNLKPQGSGTAVWLVEQVLALPDGEALVEEARPLGPKRYRWLCEQLLKSGFFLIVDEYERRKHEDALLTTYRNKQRQLKQCQERLAEQPDWTKMQREAEKIQKYLDEHAHIPALIEQRGKEDL